MTNTDTATAAPAATPEKSRTKIADRDWIDANGAPVENEKDATAARYTLFSPEKFGAENVGKSATFTPKTDDVATRMCAIMGALTLMGNIANTWLTEKGEKSASPIDDINERFQLIMTGEWADRTGSGVGAKVDKDALALAIVEAAIADGKAAPDVGKVRAKLESDPTWGRAVRQNAKVAAKYAEAIGKSVKSLDELMTGL